MSDTERPIRVLSLGAGVQSTTLLYMMIAGEVEPADHVIFADTGWEPKAVYEHLDRLRVLIEEAGMEFHLVSKGNIRNDFFDGTSHFASMPLHIRNGEGKKAMARRQCTSEYKLTPIKKKTREIAGLVPRARSTKNLVTMIIGISWDESQRMKDPFFPWITNEYPLVDRRLTRQDCIDWSLANGYERPPRSACVGCPFKNAEEWRYLKTQPEEWADAVEFDEALRSHHIVGKRFNGEAYLHSSMKPLTEVDLRTETEMGIITLFDQECEGMCGL